jgi:hypothetical protein
VELLAVGLEGIWIGGIDWIGLDGCEGGPEMVVGWEWERRTYVRTVLYYCVVCQPAVPVPGFTFDVGVVLCADGMAWNDLGRGIVRGNADVRRFVTRLFCWLWTTQLRKLTRERKEKRRRIQQMLIGRLPN